MAEQEQNRSENATPHKLKEAKKKGSVAKSPEVNSLLLLAGLLGVLYVWGWEMTSRQLALSQHIFSTAHLVTFTNEGVLNWSLSVATQTLVIIAPLLIIVVILAIVANLGQTGVIFSSHPLKPDFSRINPATGLKRVFSMKTLFEAGKTILKLILLGAVMYAVVSALLPEMLGLHNVPAVLHAKILLSYVISLLFKLLLVIIAIALLDLAFTRKDFLNKMKMSRREVTEEIKSHEGDPRVRARIKELQKELLSRSKALRRLPEADVLITNPTHFAVAIGYKPEEMDAPVVLAKGAHDVAQKMKILARQHGIPVVEHQSLARLLFRTVALEGAVHEKAFGPVAKILVWVYASRTNDKAN